MLETARTVCEKMASDDGALVEQMTALGERRDLQCGKMSSMHFSAARRMHPLRHAGLWQAEFAAGLVDVATGALLAIRLGELVVQLVKCHLGNHQQAQLLQQYVEIIVPEVRRLHEHVRAQAEAAAGDQEPIRKAINLVFLSLEVWCYSHVARNCCQTLPMSFV